MAVGAVSKGITVGSAYVRWAINSTVRKTNQIFNTVAPPNSVKRISLQLTAGACEFLLLGYQILPNVDPTHKMIAGMVTIAGGIIAYKAVDARTEKSDGPTLLGRV